MTPSQFKSWMISVLRRASYLYPPRNAALVAARVSRGIYKCAICNNEFRKKDIQIDHVEPTVDPAKGFVDWDTYILRMFPSTKGFQILCKPCHKDKTDKENKRR